MISGGKDEETAEELQGNGVEDVGVPRQPQDQQEVGQPDLGDGHPPHIHEINVQCAKDMMTITIEFNRVFNGVIYSKVGTFFICNFVSFVKY